MSSAHLSDLPAPTAEQTVALLVARHLRGDAAAFESLVKRFFPLVMSAAWRRTGGWHSLAEEVTQVVFIDLAKRLPGLRADERLGGWLHTRTIRAAADLMKSETRRKARETESARDMALATEPVKPLEDHDFSGHLDEALSCLSQAERDAVLLRFVDGRDFRRVGLALGVSEDTAQKRVSRALEKLRRFLGRRCAMPQLAAIGLKLTTDATAAAAYLPGKAAVLTSLALAGANPAAPFSRFWPHGKAALIGISAAGMAWTWPMTRMGYSPPIPPAATVPGHNIKAPGIFPDFPPLPALAKGLSVDEIVQGIAALAAGPNTRQARDRFAFYARELGGRSAGEALRKLQRLLSGLPMRNFHQRYWRFQLINQWGEVERVAALNFVMRNLPPALVPDQHDTSTGSLRTLLGMLVDTSDPDKGDSLAVGSWIVQTLAAPARSYPSYIHATLTDSAYGAMSRAVNDQSKAALALWVEGANVHQWKLICRAPETIGDDDKAAADKLQLLADLLPDIKSPALRDQLQQAILKRLGNESFEDACAIVNGMSDKEQQLKYAELVARPPGITDSHAPDPSLPKPQPQYRSRADWWLSLETPEKQPDLAKRIGSAWLDIDFDFGMDWLSSKIPSGSMLAFLEEKADFPAYSLATYPNGPNPRENQRILTHVGDRVKQQFPQAYPAFRDRLLGKHKGLPGIETLELLLKP